MDNLFVGRFTIGQTLDRGIRLYKKTISKVLLTILIPFALGFLNIKNIMGPMDPTNPFAVFTPLYFLSIILSFWAWIVVIRYIYQTSLGEELDFGKIIKLAKPSDLLLIITFIIWYLLAILSAIALVIPCIYLMNISMIGLIVIVVERKYFIDGITRTFTITKGRWWKTFVINLVTYLIILIPAGAGIGIFMGTVFKSVTNSSFIETGMMPDMSITAIIGMIVYMIIIALIYPLFFTINIIHYNSLRSEKENIDLDGQLDSLGEVTTKGA